MIWFTSEATWAWIFPCENVFDNTFNFCNIELFIFSISSYVNLVSCIFSRNLSISSIIEFVIKLFIILSWYHFNIHGLSILILGFCFLLCFSSLARRWSNLLFPKKPTFGFIFFYQLSSPQPPSYLLFFFKKIFIYLFIWLCWVLVVARRLLSCSMRAL